MILVLSFILFIKTSSSSPRDRNKTYAINIYDSYFDLEQLLRGDLANMDELFLPETDDESSDPISNVADHDEDDELEKELALKKEKLYQWEEFQYLRPEVMTRDVAEFNDVTRTLMNVTSSLGGRRAGWWRGWWDPEDWYALHTNMELVKKERFMRMHLQWIIHARYQVKKALLLKHEKRQDKRYRIGYLMSRLRIIKHEQQKITSYAFEQEDSYFRGLDSVMRLYEKMVRHDVDLRDTVNLIKAIDKEPEPTTMYGSTTGVATTSKKRKGG